MSLAQNLQQIEDGPVDFFSCTKLYKDSYQLTFKFTIAVSEGAYLTRSITQNKIKPIPARTKVFENLFFPYCINKWSKLNDKIRNKKSINKFKVTTLNFCKPKGNSVFDIHDTNGVKLLSRLMLNFSHLNEQKFRHNSNDTVGPCAHEVLNRRQHFITYFAVISIPSKDQSSLTMYLS